MQKKKSESVYITVSKAIYDDDYNDVVSFNGHLKFNGNQELFVLKGMPNNNNVQ